jgi:ABC-2 type transport system permease protein
MKPNYTIYFLAKDTLAKPAKWLALIIWFLVSMYAVLNGHRMREAYLAEVDTLKVKQQEARSRTLSWYDSAMKGPKEKPWIDITAPLWAHVQANNYHFKELSPTMVLALGEAPYQPYYSSTARYIQAFSSDLQGEINNPDILQIGFFDFSFCWIYLMPLVLMLCSYDYGSYERDRGFASLLTVHTGNFWWLNVKRMLTIAALLLLVGILLIAFAAWLTSSISMDWLKFLFPMCSWLAIWVLIVSAVYALRGGVGLQATYMVSVWLLLCMLLPSSLELSIKSAQPVDYQPELVNGMRDDIYSLYKLKPDTLKQVALALYPEYAKSACASDTTNSPACAFSMYDPMVINRIENRFAAWADELEQRHAVLLSSSWLAPVLWIQHHFHLAARTSFQDYLGYRKALAKAIKANSELVMRDAWAMQKVDADRYKKVYCVD